MSEPLPDKAPPARRRVESVFSAEPDARQNPLPRANPLETLQILRDVELPMIAKGPIIRRPKVVGLVERTGFEARAVRRMQTIAGRYGSGPLMLSLPKNMATVLDPEHVHRILDASPEPFAPAETLKRHALKHFEPKVALISHDEERTQRRRMNESALDNNHPIHRMAETFMPAVREEAEALLRDVDAQGGTLKYMDLLDAWFRVVRRVVLGDSYRDDKQLTELIEKLRADGNWAFLKPVDKSGRQDLLDQLHAALDKGEPGSIAAFMRDMDFGSEDQPAEQIPQWLFAFDPAGMATARALALLAEHPQEMAKARKQIAAEGDETAPMLQQLRGSVLESLRLWATTPMILRETTQEVEFEHGVMPAGTTVLIFAPFFHRDDRNLDFAHSFSPEIWEEPRTRDDWPLLPFSGGTGICPGRHLVLLLTSSFLAEIISAKDVSLTSHDLEPGNLPGLLNNFALEFQLT
ncbi:cytochrome P450 [Nesterenkonia populi]|uniref:cytochrome P450 n=1 Tax=Nesterenkonia populi TaxID=1591087 RepID=UPI0011BE3EAC|nr:cytochrome P450 [Nesterenkonia populi]